MATPSNTITTVDGRRCTRVRRTTTTTVSTTPLPDIAPASSTDTQLSSSTVAVPGTQSTFAVVESLSTVALPSLTSSAEIPSEPPRAAAPLSVPSPSPPSISTLLHTPASTASSTLEPASSIARSVSLSSTISLSTQRALSDLSTPVTTDIPTSTSILSHHTSSFTVASTIAPIGSSHVNHAASLSAGAIAGIIVGALSGLGMAAMVLFCCVRRKRSGRSITDWRTLTEKRQRGEESEQPGSEVRGGWAAFPVLFGVLLAKLKRRQDPNNDARSIPNSPYLDQMSAGSRFSASSAGSTRHLRSASAPASNRLKDFKDRFKRRLGRERAISTDSVRSFYTPTPPNLAIPPMENPFKDPDTVQLRVTNPDSSGIDGVLDQQRTPLTPGTPNWRQSTPVFQFPLRTQAEDPFVDPPPDRRQSIRTVNDDTQHSSAGWLHPSHNRTHSNATALSSHPASSFYSTDSLYNIPNSVHIPPLKPAMDPFHDRNATDFPKQRASIYVLPGSHNGNIGSKAGGPAVTIPLPSSNSALAHSASTISNHSANPLPTTSSTRSSYFGPGLLRPRNRSRSRSSSRRATTISRATRGKSDPFDLDRPEVLGASYGEVPDMPQRGSSTTEWG